MTKSSSCYERIRSFLTRRRSDESDGEGTQICSRDTDDDHEPTVHYFNHAAQAPLSPEVQKLGIELIRSPPWNTIDDRHSGPHSQARVRSLFSMIVEDNENEDAKGSRIAMFPSTAFAITLAARNIAESQRKKNTPGGRILVLMDQFDSAVYPWQQVCDESSGKLTLEIVGYPDDNGDLQQHDCEDNVSGWTLAVLNRLQEYADEIVAACLPPLHWSDGTLLDLEAIGKVCRQHNIPLIVDATQGMCVSPWIQKL